MLVNPAKAHQLHGACGIWPTSFSPSYRLSYLMAKAQGYNGKSHPTLWVMACDSGFVHVPGGVWGDKSLWGEVFQGYSTTTTINTISTIISTITTPSLITINHHHHHQSLPITICSYGVLLGNGSDPLADESWVPHSLWSLLEMQS